jgi:hypothetical protein
MPFHRFSFVFVALVGCASESRGGPGSVHDAGTQPSADGPKQPAHRCDGPGYAGTEPDVTVVHVSATVVDEAKNPVPKMLAQACGVNVCVNGATDDTGIVVIDTNTKEQRPAFKYGDGKTHAKFALLLGDTSPVNVDLGPEGTVAFDPPADGAPLDPGTTASSRGVELALAADMNPAKPDPFDFDTPDLKKFRAALVSEPPAAVDPSLGFGIVVALTPSGTELCPPAKLTVPNTASWPAGAAVEVFLHGIDVGEAWAPYGGWAKVSDAAVSADGKTISTSDAGGLPALSVVGLRAAR